MQKKIEERLTALYSEDWKVYLEYPGWQRESFILEAYNICQDLSVLETFFGIDEGELKGIIEVNEIPWEKRHSFYWKKWFQYFLQQKQVELLNKCATSSNPKHPAAALAAISKIDVNAVKPKPLVDDRSGAPGSFLQFEKEIGAEVDEDE